MQTDQKADKHIDKQTNKHNINRRVNTHAHMYTTLTGKQNKHKVMETILP